MRLPSPQIRSVLIAMLCVLILDQVTKLIILNTIKEGSVSFIGREETFFFFTHERNEGLVGGAFRDHNWIPKLAPILATIVLLYLFKHLDASSPLQNIAYGMVAGGALGNLFDRLVRHSVVDFLQFNFYFIPFDFPWKQYPAFNVADSAICIGVFLLILSWRKLDTKDDAVHAS